MRSGAPPKAHHFIPVGHLARFGEPRRTQRDAKLWVRDKVTDRVRLAKAGRVATQNDLYTYRVPLFPLRIDGLDALAAAIGDAANRDWWVETDKAEIEHRGVQALAALERLPAGTHRLTEFERVDVVAYVALLLTQHPTMMRRRAAAATERFWTAAQRFVSPDSPIRSLFTGLGQGDSVLGLIPDQLSLALELNYLSWSVVRWVADRASCSATTRWLLVTRAGHLPSVMPGRPGRHSPSRSAPRPRSSSADSILGLCWLRIERQTLPVARSRSSTR